MVLTIIAQNGGTGKTTTAAAVAQAAGYLGKRVLAIDFDPQGHLSWALNADRRQGDAYQLITGTPAREAIQTAHGIDVIASNPALSTLRSGKGSARRLEYAIESIRGLYDLIVIDTPATAGELQYNAIQAADGVVIPLVVDTYSIMSLYQTADTVEQIRQTNERLRWAGLVLPMYNSRPKFNRQMRDKLEAIARDNNIEYLGAIRVNTALKEAAGLRESLYSYAPKSAGAQDYLQITRRILEIAE